MRLEFDDVSRRFRNDPGVTHLDLAIEPGEITALVGLNGAGKTTLMRLALGMLRPDTGTVRLDGVPSATLPRSTWRSAGHLIEVPLAYPELTARQNLRMAARLRGAPLDVVERAIAEWNLDRFADRRTRSLSLGNRQRVGIAAALQHAPNLVVLDEPSNALDPAGVMVLREALLRLAAAGAAVLVSSHHLDEVARIAHRIVLMNGGRLIGEVDPATPELERVFFDRVRIDDDGRVAA